MDYGNIGKLQYKIDPLSNCYVCISHYLDKNKYPSLMIDGKMKRASRYVYELYSGEIPKGFVIRHTCDNPSCINPDHLLVGTHADNVADKVSRDRCAKLENNGRHKLTIEQVKTIYFSDNSQTNLAKEYKVTRRVIYDIINKNTWKSITKDFPVINRTKHYGRLFGDKNVNNKLDEKNILEIYLSKEKSKFLAEKYNISISTINDIRNRRTWKWLTNKI